MAYLVSPYARIHIEGCPVFWSGICRLLCRWCLTYYHTASHREPKRDVCMCLQHFDRKIFSACLSLPCLSVFLSLLPRYISCLITDGRFLYQSTLFTNLRLLHLQTHTDTHIQIDQPAFSFSQMTDFLTEHSALLKLPSTICTQSF